MYHPFTFFYLPSGLLLSGNHHTLIHEIQWYEEQAQLATLPCSQNSYYSESQFYFLSPCQILDNFD